MPCKCCSMKALFLYPFWCCLASRVKRDEPSRQTDDYTPNPLQDLLTQPEQIHKELNLLIVAWQNSIREYERMEIDYKEKEELTGNELQSTLDRLRANPQEFLLQSGISNNLKNLAEKRQEMQSLQEKLPISSGGRMNNVRSTLIESESFAVKNGDNRKSQASAGLTVNLHESTGFSLGVFTRQLSTLWTARLNSLDPTQGSATSSILHPSSSSSRQQKESSVPIIGGPLGNMRIRPTWPSYLHDISFDVIKVNRYGHRMRRILSLTQYHVLSIKNGTAITKFYSYHDVRRALITKEYTLKVILRNGKVNTYLSPLVLHILQQIITRVKIRRALDKDTSSGLEYSRSGGGGGDSNQLSLQEGGGGDAGSKFNPLLGAMEDIGEMSVSQALIKEISEANSVAADMVMNNFAIDLTQAVKRSRQMQQQQQQQVESASSPAEDVVATVTDDANASNETAAATETANTASPSPTAAASTANSRNSNLALNFTKLKLLTYEEGSPEYVVMQQIRQILFDMHTPEGHTIANFVQTQFINGETMEIKLLMTKIRQFIEAMYDHCVEERVFPLCVTYQQIQQKQLVKRSSTAAALTSQLKYQQQQSNGGADNNNSNLIAASPASSSANIIAASRQNTNVSLLSSGSSASTSTTFSSLLWLANPLGRPMNRNQASPTANGSATTNQLMNRDSIRFLQQHALNVDVIIQDERLLAVISFLLYIAVEETVFVSSQNKLIKIYRMNESVTIQEKLLKVKMQQLALRPQGNWGIPADFISPLNWQSAILELSSLELNLIPSVQIQVLTRSIKAIYHEFKLAVLPTLKSSNICISADDLMPIFLFVFCQCHADFTHPIQNKDFMWSLCHPGQLQGEAGYCLTMYESAIQHVLEESDLSSKPERTAAHKKAEDTSTSQANPTTAFSAAVDELEEDEEEGDDYSPVPESKVEDAPRGATSGKITSSLAMKSEENTLQTAILPVAAIDISIHRSDRQYSRDVEPERSRSGSYNSISGSSSLIKALRRVSMLEDDHSVQTGDEIARESFA